jgi:site-specific DNA-methyltransferase (adenine-specific)
VTPWLDDGDVLLYRGDALRVLPTLRDASVDLVLTDPPYSSGGLHRSDRNKSTGAKYVQTGTKIQRPDFQGDHRDQRSYLAWCSLWLSECLRIVRPGRICLVFSDWRQLPTTTDALQAGGFVWRGIIAWDKGRGVRPNPGFSAQAEYLVWGSRGPLELGHDVYLDGVLQARIRHDEKEHQTGKPLGLLEQLLSAAPPGGLVLDPFAGSGSTLVAARRTGRRSIGVEIEDEYLAIAQRRLAQQGLALSLGEPA